ncbi:hypothetical protein IFT54_05605 [Sphingomonas sp. CFBP 13714]|uniref:hypothetical protein n=1 Tax=Sphingomonas sp. CFBP 13714 TaxID=2775308 RepID=UPI001784954D|nr:hypothetical protein [Sphingomonas sp. CFBP 13714]MBD8699290.1 hypothetical protein [Sphingomonas sp. CFBP 13714]
MAVQYQHRYLRGSYAAVPFAAGVLETYDQIQAWFDHTVKNDYHVAACTKKGKFVFAIPKNDDPDFGGTWGGQGLLEENGRQLVVFFADPKDAALFTIRWG